MSPLVFNDLASHLCLALPAAFTQASPPCTQNYRPSTLQFHLFIPLSAANLVMKLPQVHQGVPLQDRAGSHDPADHVGRHPDLIYVLGVSSIDFQQTFEQGSCSRARHASTKLTLN